MDGYQRKKTEKNLTRAILTSEFSIWLSGAASLYTMARILYGVHGTGKGHVTRALSLARGLPKHKYLFVADGTAFNIIKNEYPVIKILTSTTEIKGHKVNFSSTIKENLVIFSQAKKSIDKILNVIDRFKPDIAITDYELFVPIAARKRKIPCLSLDHQHIITLASYKFPKKEFLNRFITATIIRAMFSYSSSYIITSFFQLPLKYKNNVRLLPPLIRKEVFDFIPSNENHVLAYQGYSTNRSFFNFLKNTGRQVYVYGFYSKKSMDNLIFKGYSEREFLKDLASCAYVICGGSHTLISEALFYGKPVMAYPIRNAFEQFLNAYFLEMCNYGLQLKEPFSPKDTISYFESSISRFKERIKKDTFCGNREIFGLVEYFINNGKLP